MKILIVKASKRWEEEEKMMLESKVNIIMEQTDRQSTQNWVPAAGI